MADHPDTESTPPEHHRPIRSFVRREGRLTTGQAKALEEHWARFGLDDAALRQPNDLFEQSAPLRLEIGFGDGDNLLAQAKAHPDQNFLGLEVHRPGVGRLLAGAAEADLHNLRAGAEDAAAAIRDLLPEGSVSRVDILFPDPWHKARHNKRRIIQPLFLSQLHRVMVPGGVLRLATDWAPYAEHMIEVCSAHPDWQDDGPGALQQHGRIDDRIETKFERRGLRLGHGVTDLRYKAV